MLDELYVKGASNEALAERLKPFLFGQPVICDSAEPKSIQDLRRHGVPAYPARKGPDSLRHGIAWIKARQILVAPHCHLIQAELSNYRWRQDAMDAPSPAGGGGPLCWMPQLRAGRGHAGPLAHAAGKMR